MGGARTSLPKPDIDTEEFRRMLFEITTGIGTGDNEASARGTGFFVTRSGYAVTCKHLFEDKDGGVNVGKGTAVLCETSLLIRLGSTALSHTSTPLTLATTSGSGAGAEAKTAEMTDGLNASRDRTLSDSTCASDAEGATVKGQKVFFRMVVAYVSKSHDLIILKPDPDDDLRKHFSPYAAEYVTTYPREGGVGVLARWDTFTSGEDSIRHIARSDADLEPVPPEATSDSFAFTNLRVRDGTSGCPVLNLDKKVLGMVTKSSDSTPDGTEVDSKDVVNGTCKNYALRANHVLSVLKNMEKKGLKETSPPR